MMPTNPGMQPTQTMQLPVQPPAEEPRRRRRAWLRWAVPLLAFLLAPASAGPPTRPT